MQQWNWLFQMYLASPYTSRLSSSSNSVYAFVTVKTLIFKSLASVLREGKVSSAWSSIFWFFSASQYQLYFAKGIYYGLDRPEWFWQNNDTTPSSDFTFCSSAILSSPITLTVPPVRLSIFKIRNGKSIHRGITSPFGHFNGGKNRWLII